MNKQTIKRGLVSAFVGIWICSASLLLVKEIDHIIDDSPEVETIKYIHLHDNSYTLETNRDTYDNLKCHKLDSILLIIDNQ